MREQILQLWNSGKSYNEIVGILGCSRSLVSYYCGNGVRESHIERQRKRRKEGGGKKNVIAAKVSTFKKDKGLFQDKIKNFQSRISGRYGQREKSFSCNDVLEKFGEKTECYLTGQPIDLTQPRTYSFDHIIPKAKGGKNSLENLGVACREANQAKHDLLVEDLLSLCERILVHHGYEVKKPSSSSNAGRWDCVMQSLVVATRL